MTDSEQPFVSIILPIRNEEDFIERTLRSILENDYAPERVEIMVVDGMSDDRTRQIVTEMAQECSHLKLLDNPLRVAPCALNIGLRAMRGELFTIIGGHAEIAPDFIRRSVETLLSNPEAWIVGGSIETIATGYSGNAIAAAMRSPIGVGDSLFRLGNYEGWVDTLAFGTHHRWILDKIGYFDEELIRNQDDDFNMRVHLGGGKIWLSQSIKSKYYSRSSLRKLWRQYFQYGFWRIRTMQKHRRPATLRQAVPLLFAGSLLVLAAAGFFWRPFWWLLGAELVLYAVGIAYGSIDVAGKAGLKYLPPAPIVFLILHFGYGLGSLWGLVRFVLLRGWKMKRAEEFNLSR